MLDDFINLTQGQLLVKYWPLWTIIALVATTSLLWDRYKRQER